MITDNEAVLIKNEETEKIEPIFKDIKQKNIAFRFVKRSIDIIASIIGIILLIPITVLVFIMNIFTGEGGAIFYTQERIGKNGKNFKMYKYRTMCKNADKILEKRLLKIRFSMVLSLCSTPVTSGSLSDRVNPARRIKSQFSVRHCIIKSVESHAMSGVSVSSATRAYSNIRSVSSLISSAFLRHRSRYSSCDCGLRFSLRTSR